MFKWFWTIISLGAPVSSHDGLKNETYVKTDTLYLTQINSDSAFWAT